MQLARLIGLVLVSALTIALLPGCGSEPTPTTGPNAPPAPGAPPGGP